MKVEEIPGVRFGLGESPLWDERQQLLYTIDIMARQVLRYDPASGAITRLDVGEIIGALALRESGGAIVALANGIHSLDFETGTTALIADPEANDRSLVLSEGKVDPAGRFLFASFSMAMQSAVGTLYALNEDRRVTKVLDGIIVPNGLAWSPDGRTLYFADSGRHLVSAFDYDVATGTASNQREFANTEALGGIPDGAAVDREGNYWIAICKGGIVARFSPGGELTAQIEFPTKWVSSVAFAGRDLNDLYVTSVDPRLMNMGEDPEGGKLFVVRDIDSTGLESHRYAG